MNPLQSILLTLRYCLATFRAACQCQCCEPCTQGQKNIQKAIHAIEDLLRPGHRNPNTNIPIVRYALERSCSRAEFQDRTALLHFLREMLPAELRVEENADITEIAVKAATKQWTLLTFEPGQYVQLITLLEASLNLIHMLIGTTELNMDALEPATLEVLTEVASFQSLAVRMGFHHNCDLLPNAQQSLRQCRESDSQLTVTPNNS